MTSVVLGLDMNMRSYVDYPALCKMCLIQRNISLQIKISFNEKIVYYAAGKNNNHTGTFQLGFV